MKGMEYIAASADIKAAGKLVSIYRVIITATAGTGVATFKTGGVGGTTVADIRMVTSGISFACDLCGTQADYLVLSNCVAMVEWD